MARRTLPLTDTEVRNAKPKDIQYALHDGEGLFLLIMPNRIVKGKSVPGSKLWRLKYRLNGVERLTSLGNYKNVSLELAREKRKVIRDKIAAGVDPIKEKEEVAAAIAATTEHTLENIGREWHKNFISTWSLTYGAQKLARLEKEIFPYLGSTPVTELTGEQILISLRRIQDRGNLDLAHRMHYDIRKILTYAIATGRLQRNVAADIVGSLPPTTYGNRAAFTEPDDVKRLIKSVWIYHGHPTVCAAIKLAPMLFVRPGELRHMEWSEIDFEKNLWSIPGVKMKMENPHLVPLPKQAVAILKDIQYLNGSNQFVFPNTRGSRGKHAVISENTLNIALRTMGFTTDEVCSHGFRATARTICDEVLEIRTDFLEHQLAHVVKDPNGRAYNRTKYINQRREFMQVWADYLDQLRLS